MDYTRPPQLPRLVRLDAARNYLLSGDAAALTASPSRCRYDRKALDDLQDLLSQTGARLRGQVDRGRPQWIGSAEFNHDYVLVCRSYFTPNGQLSVIEAVSRQTYRAEEVKNRAVPVRHPNATEPRYRLVLKNLKVEVVPLLKSATETAPASGDVTYEPSPRRSRRQREKGQGRQTVRARAVLKRLYSEGYPTKEEVPNVDVLDAFDKEYKRVGGKKESRLPKPSDDVVLRELGRKD